MSKWFKNKKTGLVWEAEGDLEKRLGKNSGYEQVEALKQEKSIDKMSKAELLALAQKKGVEVDENATKAQIIEAITGGGEEE